MLELVVVPGRKAEFYGHNPSVKLSLSQGAPGDRKSCGWSSAMAANIKQQVSSCLILTKLLE